MPSFNRVVLIGRLTRDPELRYTAGGLAVTSFSLAVDRRFKNQQTGERQTDFFRCKAWRQQAEFVANYVTKGRLVCVEGRIEISEVVGQDGVKKYFTDIVCDTIETLDAKRDEGEGAPGEGEATVEAAPGENAPAPTLRPTTAPRPAAPRPAPRAPVASVPSGDDYDDADPFADG